MAGRHRADGPAPRPFVPRTWNVRERAMAEQLTAIHPGWLVVWGTYWRCWSAFGRFTAGPLVLNETDPDVLAARMRAVEPAARTRRGW